MKFSKKIAIAAVPAVMALASTNVDSKILLMSQEGWEVSFDGAANAFVMQNSGTNAPTTSGGAAVAFDVLEAGPNAPTGAVRDARILRRLAVDLRQHRLHLLLARAPAQQHPQAHLQQLER